MTTEMNIAYPTVAESEDRMLDDLALFLDQFELESADRHRLTLCISEAFTNALKHGNNWDPSKRVFVNITVKVNAIIADITDEGTGGLEAISRRPRPDIEAESGRGVDFIYRFCPDAKLSEVSTGGLKVSLQVPLRMQHDKSTLDISRR